MPTQNMGATKFYSNKQESLIADYLGWKRTSGSGARPFQKGDIYSDDFLGECKTHTKSQADVAFMLLDWRKLLIEAKGASRKPILFSDNGTQKLDATFCMIDRKFSDVRNVIQQKDIPAITSVYLTKIRFNADALKYLLGDHSAFSVDTDNMNLVIMPLVVFKRMLDGDFYD